MSGEFEWCECRPTGELGRFVESIWCARGTIRYPRERVSATGSSVAGFVLGAPILQTPDDGDGKPLLARRGFLIGPNDRPIVNEPTAETYCVGIVTTPVGTRPVFGVDPRAVRARVVELDDVWLAAPELRKMLISTSPFGSQAMLDELHLRLGAALVPEPHGAVCCERVVARLREEPSAPIAAVAHSEGISHGHLDRLFGRVVGLSPVRLGRVLRVRRLLDQLDVFDPPRWAQLAAAEGWFDQAHLIRAFRRHTGVTPADYVGAQQRHFTPEDAAPGFVPSA